MKPVLTIMADNAFAELNEKGTITVPRWLMLSLKVQARRANKRLSIEPLFVDGQDDIQFKIQFSKVRR